ncbi:MAG: hypothetical protein HY727_13635 [Candidatus Rokubacteria bacterium]|nr:hypothetical protein [Candidatus Rokubacteria bacterium]
MMRPGTPRAVLWGLLATKLVGSWGLAWDIQWHLTIGRDTFWIQPHVMIYASVTVVLLLSWGTLLLSTVRLARSGGAPPAGTVAILGLAGSRGLHLVAWGVALVVLAAPIDDLWHRLFGLDVTLWSPPHLLGLFGSAVNTVGCLVLATEVYPVASRARLAALVLGGSLLYGGLRVTLDPAWLVAYRRGGVAFHAFAILAALVLPLALVTTARLAGRRSTPVLVTALAILIALAGQQVAAAGFAILEPVSVLGEEIRKDPTSPIAIGNAIVEKNRAAPDPWAMRLLLPLIPALLLGAADPRRRPLGATAVYGVALFIAYGWYASTRPAYQPLIPTAVETAVALTLTAGTALVGGFAGRALSDFLAARAPEPPGVTREAAPAPTPS